MSNEMLSIFNQITAIPHGSGNTNKMQRFIESFAKKYGYAIKQDKAGNLLAHRERAQPKICLQSHYDMVCVGLAAQNAPLTLVYDKTNKDGIEKTWLKAQDSSLGADNGMGMAIMMYFMTKNINAEFLFTNDEEIGMIGAKNLEIPIESKILINLDSEVLGEITVGCAGGFDCSFKSDFEIQEIPSHWHRYILQSHNFAGGHSGLDINNPKPEFQNAILASATFLYHLTQNKDNPITQPLYIINWKGGEKRNSIPVNSKIILATPQQLDLESINTQSDRFFSMQKLRHATNENLNHENKSRKTHALTFNTLYDVITSMHLGVLEKRGENVQSSLNLSHIFFDNGHLEMAFMGRANTKKLLDSNLEALQATLSQSYINQIPNTLALQTNEYYSPWERYKSQNTQSLSPHSNFQKILDSMLQSMESKLHHLHIKPKVVELHAGLECGVLLSCFQNMGLQDIIALSVGPTINSPHSLNECVWIESAEVLLVILEDFITKISQT
ncbi:aminoacyl-histidine dipeptidase [Helicobacter sp. MIT 14-3879]|uniref:aminoacyl-histidine dipeptidase n=1 Tax=Helicobacter sp. MIT 14-3879 TaxID=2040649 RepID=UPI000E1F445A|nr:aminoacyl-histidine dipeptidase [Helicobacter sp. MIT 14-3879]RDU61222.1 aminoacyl-histidine dipeptidase [Helicobacter sp. MIT 14-3879]